MFFLSLNVNLVFGEGDLKVSLRHVVKVIVLWCVIRNNKLKTIYRFFDIYQYIILNCGRVILLMLINFGEI